MREADPAAHKSGGAPLTDATGSVAEVVGDFLETDSLSEVTEHYNWRTGITHVRLEQMVAKMRRFGFALQEQFTDPDELVAVLLLTRTDECGRGR